MSMCRVFSCVVGRGSLLWPVLFLGKSLLGFALLHSTFQGQICLLVQVSLDFLLLHSSSLQWKGHLFWVLVLKGPVGLHRTVQLRLLQHYWLGHRLWLLWYWMVWLGNYGVITHLEPDILECEVKWAVESITTNKASGGDEIPVELFQILKDDAVKVLHLICQQIWKTQQWPLDWKRSVFIPIPKKGNAKECSNYCTIALTSHASKVMLKILQARLHNMWTMNFLMFKLVLEKAEEPEIK